MSTTIGSIDIDKSTWDGIEFEALRRWRYIGIHAHHQQRCENFVQMAALIAKTRVGEKRLTWRGICHSVLLCPFNMHSVARRKKEEEDKEKEFKGRRVSRSYHLQYFLDWMRDFVDEAADATKKLDKERVEALKASIADGSKASAKENDAFVEATKAEMKHL